MIPLSEKFWKWATPFIAAACHIFGVLENTLQSREFTEVAEIAERVKKWSTESDLLPLTAYPYFLITKN